MNDIHSTAIIGPGVELGEDNVIGPFVVLDGDVTIGSRNRIAAHVVVYGPCVIGDDNAIDPHVVINTAAEIRGQERRGTQIGSRNVLKEFVAIQGGDSSVGDDCFLMDKTHVAHDCRLGDYVTMAPTVVLAGHVVIGDYATVGIGTNIHQHVNIGEGAMIGMNSTVLRDVDPWATVVGSPAKVIGVNEKGMERWGRIPDSTQGQ
jgi:UDP-N-acetylglucosamine acyltransferase